MEDASIQIARLRLKECGKKVDEAFIQAEHFIGLRDAAPVDPKLAARNAMAAVAVYNHHHHEYARLEAQLDAMLEGK